MSELSEALEWWDEGEIEDAINLALHRPTGVLRRMSALAGAARRLDEFPTAAQVEAAAKAIWERNNDGNYYATKQARTGSYLKAQHDARAALEAAKGSPR